MGHDRMTLLDQPRSLWLLLVCLYIVDLSGHLGASAAQPLGGCGEADARAVVQRFVDSFNRGDTEQLNLTLAPAQTFRWYSTDAPGEMIDPVARDRSNVLRYFEFRHKQHERLVVTSFDFVGKSGNLGNFSFELIRSADDGLKPTQYTGKGAIACQAASPTLAVWSMARRPDFPVQLVLGFSALLIGLAIASVILIWRIRHTRRAELL